MTDYGSAFTIHRIAHFTHWNPIPNQLCLVTTRPGYLWSYVRFGLFSYLFFPKAFTFLTAAFVYGLNGEHRIVPWWFELLTWCKSQMFPSLNPHLCETAHLGRVILSNDAQLWCFRLEKRKKNCMLEKQIVLLLRNWKVVCPDNSDTGDSFCK